LGTNNVSQEMLGKIDQEVKKIIDTAYAHAVALIKEKKDYLDKVAEKLIKDESLDQDEFEKLVGKKEA